ncbi:MAG TPA: YegS/Rv2252/BmrU family lipid kinase [Candidatus Merdenecus merdavium]|nr:YegS/Rv2252/BmrU family lipid kinase [Candidatus Merdenecus merdavium]
MKKMLFVFNPKAGKALIKNRLLEIIDLFVKEGYEVTTHPTQAYLDAFDVVKERGAEYDLVVCSGGDGTLDEVVSGMMHLEERIPIGYIPAGSTNDFANSLKLPKNMIKAANTIMKGKRFSCDIGSFNDSFFVYIAAFGIFTDVSYETKQELKNILGHLAYLLEGVKRLYGIKSYHLKAEYEDQEIEGDFIYGMITNSISVGGFKNMTGKNVKLNDGVFEVTLIQRPANPIELQEIITSLMTAEVKSNNIYSFKTSHLKITSDMDIPWTLDGEYGGEHIEVDIKNENHAVDIMVDPKY